MPVVDEFEAMKTKLCFAGSLSPLLALVLCAGALPKQVCSQVVPPPPKDFDPMRLPMEMQLTNASGPSTFGPDATIGTPFTIDPLASAIPAVMPEQGKIVEESIDERTGIWSAWLSNGVRIHVRATPVPPGAVARDQLTMMRMSLYGAELLETAENRGVSEAAAAMVSRPQPTNFRAVEVEKFLKERSINWQAGSGADMIFVQGAVPRKYLPWLMQFAHLAIMNPGPRDREFAGWKRDLYNNTQLRSMATWTNLFPEFGAATNPSGDPRLNAPTLDSIAALSPQSARAWLMKAANEWPLEISIVGPVDVAALKGDIAKYFASLPLRERVSPSIYESQRKVPLPAIPLNVTKQVVSKTDRSAMILGAPAPDESDVLRVQALQLAADMIEGRLRSTITRDGPASPGASALQGAVVTMLPGGAFPGLGTFSIALNSRDATSDAALAQAMPAIEDFYENGPTENEHKVTVKRFADELSARWKGQQVWTQALSTATYTGLDLHQFATLPETVASITREQVHQAFREVWQKPTPYVVTLVPEPGKRPGPLQRMPAQQPVVLPAK